SNLSTIPLFGLDSVSFITQKFRFIFSSVIFISVACNGPGIAEGGASQHLTPTEIPLFKSKQIFLKKQLTPACGNTLLAVRSFIFLEI
ncbi:hypothetical protein PG623_10650, partial [Riemerella anatipestifer]|nr:hypothetical protein [Riemerella anatipestifer]